MSYLTKIKEDGVITTEYINLIDANATTKEKNAAFKIFKENHKLFKEMQYNSHMKYKAENPDKFKSSQANSVLKRKINLELQKIKNYKGE